MVSDKIQKLVDDTAKYNPPFINVMTRTKQLSIDETREFFTELDKQHPEILRMMDEYNAIPIPDMPVTMNPVGFGAQTTSIPPDLRQQIARMAEEVLGKNPVQTLVDDLRKDPKYKDFELNSDPAMTMRVLMPKLLQMTVGNKEILDMFVESIIQSDGMQQDIKHLRRAAEKDKLVDSLLPSTTSTTEGDAEAPPTTTQ